MAEPTLALSYDDFVAEVGDFLGYGRAPTGGKLAEVDRLIQMGYRTFLTPPALEGRIHRWSFLKPRATLTLDPAAPEGLIDLPDNYGGIAGGFTYGVGAGYTPIAITGEARIRALLQQDDRPARPTLAAVLPRPFDPTVGQRFAVTCYPRPDQVYTVTYRYVVVPERLSATRPYPLGGTEHGETVLAAMLAQAELHRDDELGRQHQEFTERLVTSIQLDLQNQPEFLGYMGNGGGAADLDPRRCHHRLVHYTGPVWER